MAVAVRLALNAVEIWPTVFMFSVLNWANSGVRMYAGRGMIVLDRWVENLRCPICRKTGAARLSQADGWNVHMDSVPEGFKVVGSRYGSNFYCTSCNCPVEP